MAKRAVFMARYVAMAGPGIKRQIASLEILANCAYVQWQMARNLPMAKRVGSKNMGNTGRWVTKSTAKKAASTTLVQRSPMRASVTKTSRNAQTGEFVVSPSRVTKLGEIGFTSDEVYRIVAPRRTLDRRKQNNELLTLAESDRVQRLERVMAHAIRVFGNEEKASRWLRKPCRALDKAVPIELLESETGAQIVEEELHAIDHGMYA